jgi:outer membrane protein OmpA-like peptidoglycan-associated protein
MRIILTISVLLTAIATKAQNDTLKLHFGIGVASLSQTAQREIDSLLYYDILVPGKKLAIVGYADYLGSEQSNVSLSENRAKNVQDYLIASGIKSEDIQMVTGKGEVAREVLNGTAGYVQDRRVDIIPGGIKMDTVKMKTSTPGIDLSKIKKNETLRLDNVYFLPGSHKPVEASYAELKKLYGILKEHPSLKISIEGHICCLLGNTTDGYDIDAEDFNLSINRARFIYDYLVRKGIEAGRLSYKGFGKTKPMVMPEKSVDDENKNRRVEVRVIEK